MESSQGRNKLVVREVTFGELKAVGKERGDSRCLSSATSFERVVSLQIFDPKVQLRTQDCFIRTLIDCQQVDMHTCVREEQNVYRVCCFYTQPLSLQ